MTHPTNPQDELVTAILDVIDEASSQRYQVALRLATFIRANFIPKQDVLDALGPVNDDGSSKAFIEGQKYAQFRIRQKLNLQEGEK